MLDSSSKELDPCAIGQWFGTGLTTVLTFFLPTLTVSFRRGAISHWLQDSLINLIYARVNKRSYTRKCQTNCLGLTELGS